MGEVMRRTQNIMHVAYGDDTALVEVVEGAHIELPRVEGEARVDQIQHHLEIQRMSKSKGNVVNPDELVDQYGSDTVRAYLMFAFDWQKGGPWDPEGIKGPVRFLHEVWDIVVAPTPEFSGEAAEKDIRALRRKVHQMIMRVTDGLENFSFNTSIAGLMELKNAMRDAYKTPVVNTPAWQEAIETLVTMMAPFTPHIAEELWHRLGHTESIHLQPWPEADPEVAKEDVLTLAVQVNGKVRDRIEVPASTSADEAKAAALEAERIKEMLSGEEPKKVIYVPGRLVNIVV
jgi:leucyl-tRNA synthetase